MKCIYQSHNGRLTFEFEAESQKALFKKLASLDEVFNAESKCGSCDSEHILFSSREYDGNDYYELRCADCNAQFNFGQKKQGGGLFPKRKDKDDKPLGKGGWHHWQGAHSSAASVPHNPGSQPAPHPDHIDNSDIPF